MLKALDELFGTSSKFIKLLLTFVYTSNRNVIIDEIDIEYRKIIF